MPHGYKHHLFYGWALDHDKISQLEEDRDYEPITDDGSFRLLVDGEFKGYALYGSSLDWADDTTPFAFADLHERVFGRDAYAKEREWVPEAAKAFTKATGLDIFDFVKSTKPTLYIVTEHV